MLVKFSKENCFALLFYYVVLCAGCSTKEGLSHILHREFLRKNQETLQISVNLVKNVSYFLSVYCTALCTERFEHLINWLGHVANINIWSYNLKFSEKTVLYFHFTALFYVQGARKKLKIASFIEHA